MKVNEETGEILPTFRTMYDRQSPPHENNSGEIVTRPDQDLTIRELLEMHTRQFIRPVPIYYEEEMPNLKALDPVDVDRLREENLFAIRDGQQDLKSIQEEELNRRARKIAAQKAADEKPKTE